MGVWDGGGVGAGGWKEGWGWGVVVFGWNMRLSSKNSVLEGTPGAFQKLRFLGFRGGSGWGVSGQGVGAVLDRGGGWGGGRGWGGKTV